jgi:hypothetical protein
MSTSPVVSPNSQSAIDRVTLAVADPRGASPQYGVTPGTPCGCFAEDD